MRRLIFFFTYSFEILQCINERLGSDKYEIFQRIPAETWASTLFREGVVTDFILKCLAYHRVVFTLVDYHYIEGDDASLKGVKTKCVRSLHML